LFVQASLYEAMTVILLEALSLNLPIIANRIQSDGDEALTDRADGFLVEGRNPAALAEPFLRIQGSEDKLLVTHTSNCWRSGTSKKWSRNSRTSI
jgi:glycosyltransferase involved in cell wall biosynthesis